MTDESPDELWDDGDDEDWFEDHFPDNVVIIDMEQFGGGPSLAMTIVGEVTIPPRICWLLEPHGSRDSLPDHMITANCATLIFENVHNHYECLEALENPDCGVKFMFSPRYQELLTYIGMIFDG